MTTSPNSSRLNLIAKLGLFLALVGLADTSYLTSKHFLGGTVPCSILNGCETVLNSTYSTIGGVPLALLGVIFYLVVAVSLVYFLTSGRAAIFSGLLIWTGLGFLTSLYLVWLQVAEIKSLCLYCLISAAISTVLFSLTFWAKKIS